MPRPLTRTTRLVVSPSTRKDKGVPKVSGRFPKLTKRTDGAKRFETRRGAPIWPEKKSTSGLCAKPSDRPEKPCFVKAIFVGPVASERFGVEPGAYVVNCIGQSTVRGKPPAHWMRAKNRKDAVRISRAFCKCIAKTNDPDACATASKPRKRRKR